MQDYYAPYGEEGWKKRFEMTIPILLLLLVLIVLAWKLSWLCGLPGIGEIACGGTVTNILVVGDDANIAQSLDEMKVGLPINYEIFDTQDIADLRDADYLKNYDLIILTESIGSTDSAMPNLFRTYLTSYLANNGKMIMFGIAGATDPAEPSADGWVQAGMDTYVPVTCKTGICEAASKNTVSVSIADLKVKNIEHEIVKEFGTALSLQGTNIEYAITNTDEGSEILTLEVQVSGIQAYPALVESSNGISGKTLYFAYHPSRTPTIFQNAVKYITGR